MAAKAAQKKKDFVLAVHSLGVYRVGIETHPCDGGVIWGGGGGAAPASRSSKAGATVSGLNILSRDFSFSFDNPETLNP